MDSLSEFSEKKEVADSEHTSKAYRILRYGHDSCAALLAAFRTVKGEGKGAASDEQQDILRAMLVMAGASLDSSVKQLFRDAIPALIKRNDSVNVLFQRFIQRKLQAGSAESEFNSKFIAEVLTSERPVDYLAGAYVYDLTGGSLQSFDEISKAVGALGIDQKRLKLDRQKLQPIFHARNQIVHEMDIDFSAPRRNRYQRRIADAIRDTNRLLVLAKDVVEETAIELGDK